MLYLLAESAARIDPGLLQPLIGDSDPRVRLECARCLVLAGDPAGVRTLRELLYDQTGGVADLAVTAVGALGVKELLPDLMTLIGKPSGSDGARQRVRAVRAIGQLGGDEATAALQDLLTRRVSLFPGETRRFRSAVRKVLKRVHAQTPRREAPGGPSPAGAP
jgi:HEAT repeat protein